MALTQVMIRSFFVMQLGQLLSVAAVNDTDPVLALSRSDLPTNNTDGLPKSRGFLALSATQCKYTGYYTFFGGKSAVWSNCEKMKGTAEGFCVDGWGQTNPGFGVVPGEPARSWKCQYYVGTCAGIYDDGTCVFP